MKENRGTKKTQKNPSYVRKKEETPIMHSSSVHPHSKISTIFKTLKNYLNPKSPPLQFQHSQVNRKSSFGEKMFQCSWGSFSPNQSFLSLKLKEATLFSPSDSRMWTI